MENLNMNGFFKPARPAKSKGFILVDQDENKLIMRTASREVAQFYFGQHLSDQTHKGQDEIKQAINDGLKPVIIFDGLAFSFSDDVQSRYKCADFHDIQPNIVRG